MANRVVSVMLKAEIAQYMRGVTQASLATTQLGKSSEDMAKRTRGSFDLVGKASEYAGLAVAGALVGVIAKASEFESAMSAVDAATHAGVATMADLRQAAIDAGASTQYSATEAAQGITELAKAGVSAANITGGALTGALNLAAAGQLSVADAAEIAATQMTVFGLAGDKTSHVADLLAAGAGKAQGSVEDMALALQYAGLPAAGLGISIEDTTGALALFASNGLVGEKAGTSFRSMLVSMTNPVGKTRELMDELNLSFFDAQGQFIGIEGVADQLQDRLGGLTVEQRNAALAQIFGNEALGAAQALYEGGSEAVREWTNNVNDSGYAAETARRLNDNLRGDIERLGGAFDTLLISLGSGAQGPLREVVQMLTGLVDVIGDAYNWFSDLPGPVQATVGAVGALALLNGPLSGVLDTLKGLGGLGGTVGAFSEALGYARANGDGLFTVLGSVGGYGVDTAKAGMSKLVSYIGGPWGAAIAGGVLGVTSLVAVLSNVGEASVDTEGATDRMTQAFKRSKGAVDDLVISMAAQEAADQNLRYGSLLEYADKAGASLPDVTDAILGNEAALRRVTNAFQAYADTQAQEATARGEDAGGIAQLSIDADEATSALLQLAGATGQGRSEAGLLAEATGQSSSAMAGASGTTEQLTEDTADYASEVSDANKELDGLIASLAILTGAQVSLQQAQNDVQTAIMDATGAFDENGGAVLDAAGQLNGYTRNGIEAYDRLVNMAEANNTLIATMIQQGATSEEVAAKDAELRESFITTAQQMGLSRQAAENYANQIYGIPEDRTTRINADVSQASAAVSGLQAQIDQIARDRSATINLRATMPDLNGSASGTGRMGTFAEGGYTGHGGKYEAAGVVHRGEVVWSQDDVRAHGGAHMVDRMRRARGGLPGYADGGVVGLTAMGNVDNVSAGLRTFDQVINNAIRATAKALEPGTGLVAALNWAKSQAGKPYIWGSAGPAGYDCSGFMAAITNVARGRSPNSRLGSTATMPWSGFQPGGGGQFVIGNSRNTGSGIGHMAGTLLGVNVESRGGDGVVVGGSARGANAGIFRERYSFVADQGGLMRSGAAVANFSGRPERVLNPQQTAWFESAMKEVSGGGPLMSGSTKTDNRSYPLSITAGPSAQEIARAVRQTQREQEFLHA